MNGNDWEHILTIKKGTEADTASHPLDNFDEFNDFRQYLDELEMQYKGHYDELRIKYHHRSLGYGAEVWSYNLEGRFTDPTKKLLYGKQL